jgi:hypothetical protein
MSAEEFSRAPWKKLFTGVPQFRSDLTFLSMEDDTFAGLCLNWIDVARNAHAGIQEGWVEAIGVIPG